MKNLTSITKKGYKFPVNDKLYTKTEPRGKSTRKHYKSKSSNLNLFSGKTAGVKKVLKKSAVFERKQCLIFNKNLLQLLKNYKSLNKKKLRIKKSPKPQKSMHFKTESSGYKRRPNNYSSVGTSKKQLKKAKSLNRNAFKKKSRSKANLNKSGTILAQKKLSMKRAKSLKKGNRLKSSKSNGVLVKKQLISNIIAQKHAGKHEAGSFKININKFIKSKRSQNTDRSLKTKAKEGRISKSKKRNKSRSQSINKPAKNAHLAHLKKKIEQRFSEGYKGLDFKKRLKNRYEERLSGRFN